MKKGLQTLKEEPKAKIYLDSFQATLKNVKLEKSKPS